MPNCVAGSLCLLVLFASLLLYTNSNYALLHVPQQIRYIERVEWSPNESFAKVLAAYHTPVILYNTVASKWNAITLWNNPQYLAAHPDLDKLDNVEVSNEKTYHFIDSKVPFAKLPGVNFTTNFRHENISSREFFTRLLDPTETRYHYWYGKVGRTLARDVQPYADLWLTPSDKEQFGLYLWLSGAGVRPPIHIDSDHNFYVHVSGSKKFILFPPLQWKNLYMYPRLHPMWHKSQVLFESPDLKRFPNYKHVIAYEALLEPGDVLYVPPYWWHHVESITRCVSLASWSQGPIRELMRPIYERKLSFESVSKQSTRLAIVKLHINVLLEQLYTDKAFQFIADILEARWHPLRDLFVDAGFCGEEQELLEDIIIVNTKAEAIKAAENFKLLPQALREIDLGDYIETIASDSIGPENVYSFLVNCF